MSLFGYDILQLIAFAITMAAFLAALIANLRLTAEQKELRWMKKEIVLLKKKNEELCKLLTEWKDGIKKLIKQIVDMGYVPVWKPDRLTKEKDENEDSYLHNE